MVFINNKKYSCQTCIKGHRSSSCTHTDRLLQEVKPKGRPVTQCETCRQRRKSNKAHVKCICEGSGRKEPPSTIYNGLSDILARHAQESDASPSESGSNKFANLMNPCKCKSTGICTCCSSDATPFSPSPLDDGAGVAGPSKLTTRPGHSGGSGASMSCSCGDNSCQCGDRGCNSSGSCCTSLGSTLGARAFPGDDGSKLGCEEARGAWKKEKVGACCSSKGKGKMTTSEAGIEDTQRKKAGGGGGGVGHCCGGERKSGQLSTSRTNEADPPRWPGLPPDYPSSSLPPPPTPGPAPAADASDTIVASGCSCGATCGCPGCAEHSSPTERASVPSAHFCPTRCGSCGSCAGGLTLPSGIGAVDDFMALTGSSLANYSLSAFVPGGSPTAGRSSSTLAAVVPELSSDGGSGSSGATSSSSPTSSSRGSAGGLPMIELPKAISGHGCACGYLCVCGDNCQCGPADPAGAAGVEDIPTCPASSNDNADVGEGGRKRRLGDAEDGRRRRPFVNPEDKGEAEGGADVWRDGDDRNGVSSHHSNTAKGTNAKHIVSGLGLGLGGVGTKGVAGETPIPAISAFLRSLPAHYLKTPPNSPGITSGGGGGAAVANSDVGNHSIAVHHAELLNFLDPLHPKGYVRSSPSRTEVGAVSMGSKSQGPPSEDSGLNGGDGGAGTVSAPALTAGATAGAIDLHHHHGGLRDDGGAVLLLHEGCEKCAGTVRERGVGAIVLAEG